jgi:hypothetical protein
VAADEDILRAYEGELGTEPPARRNRGFWLVLGVMAAVGIFLVVEIVAQRPLANSIGAAQESLRRAQRGAEAVRGETGAFLEADATDLADAMSTLTFRGADEPSTGVRDVSVSASEEIWAAAVRARPGACFYLRLEVGEDPRYGAGEVCTGEAALGADQPRW